MIKSIYLSFLLVLGCTLFSFAQQKEISGTVSSEDGTHQNALYHYQWWKGSECGS